MTAHHDIPSTFVPSDAIDIASDNAMEVPQGQGRVVYSAGLSNPEFHSEMKSFREDFVTDIAHWFERPHDDWDRYDDDPDTLHLGLRHPDTDALVTGFRLTPVDSLENSLSLSMLNDTMRADLGRSDINGENTLTYLRQLASDGTLEDLTRLVSHAPTEKEEIKHTIRSMMELFGVAAGIVRRKHAHDSEKLANVRWLFATTEGMWQQLQKLGVQMTVIAADDFNGGSGDKSYLCLVEQENAIQWIFDRPEELRRSFLPLRDGLQKGNAL